MKSPAKLFVAALLASTLAFAPAFASPQQQEQKQKPKDKKSDVEQIGNRNVGGGLNLYSLKKKLPWGSITRRKWSAPPSWWTTRWWRST